MPAAESVLLTGIVEEAGRWLKGVDVDIPDPTTTSWGTRRVPSFSRNTPKWGDIAFRSSAEGVWCQSSDRCLVRRQS